MVPLEAFVNPAKNEAKRLITPPDGRFFATSYPFFALDSEGCKRLAFLMSISSVDDRSRFYMPAPSVLVLMDALSAAIVDSCLIDEGETVNCPSDDKSWSFESATRRSFIASVPYDALKSELRSLLDDVRISYAAGRFDLRTYRMYLSIAKQCFPAAWVPLYEKYSL